MNNLQVNAMLKNKLELLYVQYVGFLFAFYNTVCILFFSLFSAFNFLYLTYLYFCEYFYTFARYMRQGNYGNTPRLFNQVNQVRPQQQVTTQQQLQQQQQQRSMPSPGTAASARQSPFPAEAFPPPTSPTASQFPPGPNTGAPNPSAQYRIQRTTSTPSATTQLPGIIFHTNRLLNSSDRYIVPYFKAKRQLGLLQLK